MLHEWVENRSVNVALKHIVEQALNEASFWPRLSSEDRKKVLDIVQLCMNALRANGDLLRLHMHTLRPY